MSADGTCPSCGRDLAADQRLITERVEAESAPWHFKLLIAALVAYLGWRIVDLFL